MLACALIVYAVLNKTNCLFMINADLSLNLLKENGNSYYLNLCENCFKFAVSALKEHRRSTVKFDNSQDLSTDDFGVNKFRTPG